MLEDVVRVEYIQRDVSMNWITLHDAISVRKEYSSDKKNI